MPYNPYTSSWGQLENTQFDVSRSSPTYTMDSAQTQNRPTVTPLAAPAGAAVGSLAKQAAGFNPYIAAGSAVLGIAQSIIAAKKLKQLDKNKPMGYQITPEEQEAYQRTKEAARYGFSQSEKDAYMGGMQRQQDVNYQRALQTGGGSLAGAIGASTSRRDLSQVAMSDAQLKRAKEGQFLSAASAVSRKRDTMTEQNLSEYRQKQQVWGQALKSGLENVTNVANLAMATGQSA